jgi:predicted nucleic acid-binding protein
MNYILDTNIISQLLDDQSKGFKNIKKKFNTLNENSDNVLMSIVSLYELEFGYSNAPDHKKQIIKDDIEYLNDFLSIIPLSKKGSSIFGELKTSIKDKRNITQENMKKHNIDIMIASTAIAENCTLVSNDSIYNSLSQINPSLKVEDWTI